MNVLQSSFLVFGLASTLLSAATPTITAIRGGRILPMDGPEIPNGTVFISGGKITAVGRNLAIPAGARIIEARGQWVLPGLIDAHTNLGLVEDRLMESTDELSAPNTSQLRVLDGLNPFHKDIARYRRAGITTVFLSTGRSNVIGAQPTVIRLWGCTPDDMALRASAGVKLTLGEGPKKAFGAKGQMTGTRMGAASLIRKSLLEAAEYARTWKAFEAKAKSGNPDARPPKRDLALEPLAQMLEGRLTAYIEAHRADDIQTALRLVDEFKLKAILVGATEADQVVHELVRRKIPVILSAQSLGPRRMETERASMGLADTLAKEGVGVAIHGEGGGEGVGISAAEELPLAAAFAMHAGLPREAALRSITLTAAELLGVAERVGSLTPGKDADLVLFSGDPLHYRSRVKRVIVAGEEVFSAEKRP